MAVGFSRIAACILAWASMFRYSAQSSAADIQQHEQTGKLGIICERFPVPEEAKESLAFLELARKLSRPDILIPDKLGNLLTENGKSADLDSINIIWFHQGDSTGDGPASDPKVVNALRKFVQKGGGLFLSGAALAMAVELGVEQATPRRGGPGTDGSEAAIIPLLSKHPVFRSWPTDSGIIRISSSGYPAFADFHGTGGPIGGMLLARTPGGTEHPFVEYELGQGRIIVMGWRLPHYGNRNNTFRKNLEQLTANTLSYLGNHELWQKVIVTKTQETKNDDSALVVEDNEWRALELAVKDLIESYGERYSGGNGYLNRLAELRTTYNELVPDSKKLLSKSRKPLTETVQAFYKLKRDALLDNPLLEFEKIILVKRSTGNLGLPANWQSNSCLKTIAGDRNKKRTSQT